MRAVVLVGGFGTRLRPLTAGTPKQMLPVVDRPMIEWVLAQLARHGVDDAVLSLGYRPDAFRREYPDGSCAGVRLHYAVEPEPLDTAGAIRFAARDADIDETFLVVNGDVLTTLDIGALIELHRSSEAEGTIHLIPVEDPSRYGVVPTDGEGRVEAFVEKPPAGTAPSHWINAGTYVLEPTVLEDIPADRKVSVERETFPLIAGRNRLFALESDVFWVDAGTPASYLQAQLDLVAGRWGPPPDPIDPSARIADDATVDDSVVMAGASVAGGAVVRGSAVLPGARIGAGAVVDGSVVGWESVVGERAVVSRLSVLGHGAVVAADGEATAVKIPEEA